jgi:hypothetical protein
MTREATNVAGPVAIKKEGKITAGAKTALVLSLSNRNGPFLT